MGWMNCASRAEVGKVAEIFIQVRIMFKITLFK